VILSGGVRYTWLGDARPETGTPDVPHGDFTGNSALAVGFSIGYRF
jgi:long-chain fatty acid transport protein